MASILPKNVPKITIFSDQIGRWGFVRAWVFIRDFTVCLFAVYLPKIGMAYIYMYKKYYLKNGKLKYVVWGKVMDRLVNNI